MKALRWLTALILLGACMVFAASAQTYELTEIGISVDIPEWWESYSRAELESGQHPLLNEETAQFYLRTMQETDTHLFLFPPNAPGQISIKVRPATETNYSLLHEDDLATLMTEYADTFAQSGYPCEEVYLYPHTQTPFVTLECVVDNNHDIIFSTVYAKKHYIIYYYGHNDPINDILKAMLFSVVDSIVFHTESVEAPTQSTPFFDLDGGASFTVPAGMMQTEDFLDESPIHTQVTSFNAWENDSDLFMYYCMDYYELAGVSKHVPRTAYTMERLADIDAEKFAESILKVVADYGEMSLQADEWSLDRVFFQDTEFLRISSTLEIEMDDLLLSTAYTAFLHIDNGWAFCFCFFGLGEDGAEHADIDTIMNTVAISRVNTAQYDSQDAEVYLLAERMGRLIPYLILGLIIYAIVKRVRKKPRLAPPPESPQSTFSMKTYTTAQMRAAEEGAVTLGVSLAALMDHAGEALAEKARTMIDPAQGFLIVCGRGNNGGDGYVCAARLLAEGFPVTVYGLTRDQLSGIAHNAALQYESQGGVVLPLTEEVTSLPEAGLVIDAFLGTGLTRPVAGLHAHVVDLMNAHSAPKLSCDLPSGLDADSGEIMGVAVKATETLMLGLYKPAVNVPAAMPYLGKLILADIGIPPGAIPAD